MPAVAASRPLRRFLRFSVRAMIVLVMAIGAALGWFLRSAHIQRDAVAAIRRAGGSVEYDWEWREGSSVVGGNDRAPEWLVNLIGVDYFGHVSRVRFLGLWTGTDTVTAQVGRLTELEKLSLIISAISDTELAHLKGLKSLTSLDLIHSDLVTDAGLVHLKALTSLSELNLSGDQVTDAGLAHLSSLTTISILNLKDTQVTDVGLLELQGLTNLSELSLYGTLVTDAGLAHLTRLTKLSRVDLALTRVTDVGANELQRALPNLTITR
jgi:Leucine-rich repeat (LRR) protein